VHADGSYTQRRQGGARQGRRGSGSGSGSGGCDGGRHSTRFANIRLAQTHSDNICGTHEAFSLPGSMVATEPVGANVTFGAAAQYHGLPLATLTMAAAFRQNSALCVHVPWR
jgi:hypothetical protein